MITAALLAWLAVPQDAAEYVALSPRALAGALDPLLKHRAAQGLRVQALVLEELPGPGSPQERIVRVVREIRPRFLLLAADAPALPTARVETPVKGDDLTGIEFEPDVATDAPFGDLEGDALPEVAVGRLPADTPEELAAMVEKIVAYETRAPAGAWRRRLAFVAEPGNFPGGADAVIENVTGKLLSEEVPYTFDLLFTYANPKSPYFFPPARFNEHVIERLNSGCLFFIYAGHGSIDAFSSFRWEGRRIPVLRTPDAARIECREGAPVALAMACNTGEFESETADCIGEALLKRPKGPVAFIGSSRISHPYGDALHTFEMLQVMGRRPEARLGEVLREAKVALVAPSKHKMRAAADLAVGLVAPKTPLMESRLRAALSYNLLGDPALRLARVPETVAVRIERGDGGLRVRGSAEGARSVEVELLCDRRAQPHPPEGGDGEVGRLRAHERANDKVVASVRGTVEAGAFDVTLPLGALPKAVAFHVRARADGEAEAVGAVPVPKELLPVDR